MLYRSIGLSAGAALLLAACAPTAPGGSGAQPRYGDAQYGCRAEARAQGLEVVSMSGPDETTIHRTPGRDDYILRVRDSDGTRFARCAHNTNTGIITVSPQGGIFAG